MKAIKDCEFEVAVYLTDYNRRMGRWTARTKDNAGLDKLEFNCIGEFTDEDLARADFNRFAKLNNITNYKFI